MDTNDLRNREKVRGDYFTLHLDDANEAQTRFKVIDEVLRLLGWTKDDYDVEERVITPSGYKFADYVVKTVNSGIVIEAKRVGDSHFHEITRRRIKLKILRSEYPSYSSLLDQASEYAVNHSIPFACITNGNVWIIYPAHRVDKVPLQESTAIIFPSLDYLLGDGWPEFESLLSRDAVISASLELGLLGSEQNQTEDRRLRNLGHAIRAPLRHNTIYELIREGVDTAFADVSEWGDVGGKGVKS